MNDTPLYNWFTIREEHFGKPQDFLKVFNATFSQTSKHLWFKQTCPLINKEKDMLAEWRKTFLIKLVLRSTRSSQWLSQLKKVTVYCKICLQEPILTYSFTKQVLGRLREVYFAHFFVAWEESLIFRPEKTERAKYTRTRESPNDTRQTPKNLFHASRVTPVSCATPSSSPSKLETIRSLPLVSDWIWVVLAV